MKPATLRLERVALKWRDLAERRRNHFLELYQSGRWRHYYTDEDFLKAMSDAVTVADRWAAIAPTPEELAERKPAAGELAADELPAVDFAQPEDLAA